MSSKRFAIMRDLQDHLTAGRISAFDVGIYTIIHWQTDFKTGLWWGSAPKIHATAPRGTNLRDVQRSIQTLTLVGFLKPFHSHGQRGNYPVLLNKYEPLSGALRGSRLNAALSDDYRQPKYDSCAVSDAETDTEPAPIQYAVTTTQKKAKTKPTPQHFVLPDWVPVEPWNDFIKTRKNPTLRTKQLLARKLQRLKDQGQDPTAVIEQSTERGWKSFFPVSKDGSLDFRHRAETQIGTGPDCGPQRICWCGATWSWHRRPLERLKRDDPNYDGHPFAEELQAVQN